MEMAETFTADIVTRAIKSCRNSKAFGPNKLTIFHNQAANSQGRNVVLDDRPPLIKISEKELTRRSRTTLNQLRSAHCILLGSYKSRTSKDASLDVCACFYVCCSDGVGVCGNACCVATVVKVSGIFEPRSVDVCCMVVQGI